MTRLAAIALSLSIVTHPAPARQEPQGDGPRQPAERWNGAAVTRADFAAAHLRVERALGAARPAEEKLAAVNGALDRAVSFYLSGQAADAVRTLNDALDALSTADRAADVPLRVARSLKVVVDPPVYVLGAGRPSVTLTSMYPVDLAGKGPPPGPTIRLILSLRAAGASGGEAPGASTPIDVPLGPSPVRVHIPDIPLPTQGIRPGAYDVRLSTARGDELEAGAVAVADHSLGAVRIASSDRLAHLVVETPELIHALALCRARNALLTDRPPPDGAASLIADLPALEAAVRDEIQVLQALKNPYRRRTGLMWRPITVGTVETPARLYAPAAAAGDEPLPLVIALAGPGGDPDTFPRVYGDGLALRLAEKHGFILVTAQAGSGASPELFDAIVESASFDYAVDPARVYLIAHSISDRVFAEWADARRDRIAGACLIAGLPTPGKALPPTLLVAGALDQLIDPEQTSADAKAARDAGQPVELRTIDGRGHVLVVGTALPDGAAWLLKHRLEGSPPKPAAPAESPPPK